MFASMSPNMEIGGIVDSKILLSSQNDVYKIFTDSTTIKNLKVINPGQAPLNMNEPVKIVIDAQADVAAKNIIAKKFEIQMPNLNTNIAFNEDNQRRSY